MKELTIELKNHLDRLKDRFETTPPPENRRDRDFFEWVKQETNPIYELLEKWEETASSLVKERKVRIHPQQISATRENMELVLMHSYFIDARRKRYLELYQSILFIFDQLLDELNHSNEMGNIDDSARID